MSAILTIMILGCATIIPSESAPNVSLTAPRSTSSFVQELNRVQASLSNYTYTKGIGAHRVYSRRATWNTARQTCHGQQGYLAIINSIAEADAIVQLLKKSNVGAAYIGVHDLYQEDEFVTIHDDALAETGFDIWDHGQPDNHNSITKSPENCVVFQSNRKLNDVDCSNRYNFICELADLLEETQNPDPMTTSILINRRTAPDNMP